MGDSLGCVWLTGCPHELPEHLALVVGIHACAPGKSDDVFGSVSIVVIHISCSVVIVTIVIMFFFSVFFFTD